MVFHNSVNTAFGTFQVIATENGVRAINFPSLCFRPSTPAKKIPRNVKKIFHTCSSFLRQFFKGTAKKNVNVPIDWNVFNTFDQRVLKALRHIPAGQTISYIGLASKAGAPRAARAVGNALNRNPIPILIPCHRVIRKDSSVGGYRGGTRLKKMILAIEKNGASEF